MKQNSVFGIHLKPESHTLLIQIIVPWLLIFLALFLRVYKADYYPIHNESDSLKYVWAGNSLIRNFSDPISNSIFIGELGENIIWRSDYNFYDTVRRFRFHLVEPFLDTPPLGMIFFALPAFIFQYTNFTQVPPILYMLPAIILSIFSLFLTFILAKRLLGIRTAYIALIIYGFTPIFIYSHRLAYLENIITPLLLATLLLLHSFSLVPKTYKYILLLIISGLGLWIKLPAVWFAVVISFWLVRWKKFTLALGIIGVTLISLILFCVYGMSVNSQQFWKTMQIQGERGMDVNAFFSIMTSPDFYQPFRDGIYLLGFISLFALLFIRHQKEALDFLSINFFLWLIIIILTTNKTNNFFWYRMPLYPFISISLAYFMDRLFKNNQVIIALPFLVLGFFGLEALQIHLPNSILRLLFVCISFMILAPKIWPDSKFALSLGKTLAITLMVCILGLNIITTIKYPNTQCLEDNCLIPDKIMVEPTN